MLLDGLDEADSEVSPFPGMSENSFMIVSARAEKDETPKYLKVYEEQTHRIHLESLPKAAIPEWLKRTDCIPLIKSAEDENFIAQLEEITGGFPLYLHFFIDEMIQENSKGGEVQAVLNRSPKGFSRYVANQIDILADTEKFQENEKLQELFALLTVARGPVPKTDIIKLTGLNTLQLKGLTWHVTRWFSVQKDEYAFCHPLLAKEFGNALEDMAATVKEKLLGFCADWQKNKSRYAIRYYAEHLFEEKQYETLFDLARNKAFLQMQEQAFPEDVHLPLQTLQTALTGAAEKDDAGSMAEFMIAHARQVMEIMQESPLEALRKGNLKRAWELADLHEMLTCINWYLLLVWELEDMNRMKEAQDTFEQLLKKELFSLKEYDNLYADSDYNYYTDRSFFY